jgi:3-oxoadipate enol-lactonase/4-carboxymuconolactone decarboxylase
MAVVEIASGACYYRLEGADHKPVLVLSHSLGMDHGMWDAQVAALSPYFTILRYDLRGHGASAAPEGDYTIEELAGDVLDLTNALGIDRFAFCGLSLGGMIGQWLARYRPARDSQLVLANTSPRVTEPAAMEARRTLVLANGMTAVVETILGRFFSPERLAANPPVVAAARRTILATSPIGYAGCCAAIRDMDQRDALGGIQMPTLVISGDRDVSMPWPDHGGVLAAAIPGATAVRLAAAHLSNLERPRSFTAALTRFLLPSPDDRFGAGLAMRRAMLGDAHVDAAIAAATDQTREFQDLITRYAWGTIWTRPDLDTRTRRLLVLATTAALGRWEEFRLHVRTGLSRELEWCDLEEVLLQTAVYAGVPAANSGFHAALEEHARATA